MSAFEFPTDLVDKQRRFLTAEAVMERLGSKHPGPPPGEELEERLGRETREAAEYTAAYGEAQQLAGDLIGHPWWGTVPDSDRNAARLALRAAASDLTG